MPEARRRQLYDEYSSILSEAGRVTTPAGLAAAAAATAVDAGAGLPQDPEQLDWLRQEQTRLKEEYAK